MSDKDWRSFIFETLRTDVALAALLPQLPDGDPAIYGAGGMAEPPEHRPFLSIRMDPEVPGPFPGVSTSRVRLYAHDEPGDYLALDSVLQAARAALVGSGGRTASVPSGGGGVAIVWQGNSGDLSDPDLGTIFRTSDFDLQGKDGNA